MYLDVNREFKYEFFELWKATGKKMSEICDLYETAFDLAVADLYLHYQDMPFNSVSPPGVMVCVRVGVCVCVCVCVCVHLVASWLLN